MAELKWNDHIRITLNEMSWKQQLACSTAFLDWLQSASAAQDAFGRQVAIIELLILHSRIRVYQDDTLLPDGIHDIGDGILLALPLTKAALDDLPASLAQFLVTAAQEENPQTISNFTEGLTATTKTIPAL